MLRFKKQKVVRAVKGFRLPTMEYEQDMLDITDRIVMDADNTYYMQMNSDAMQHYGIYDGSLLVVDKTLNPCNGAIIVAHLNGEWLVREYVEAGKQIILKGGGQDDNIVLKKGELLSVWGVVTVTINCLLPKVMRKGRYSYVCAC